MRKLSWDYTGLAEAYTNRPDYAGAAIEAIVAVVDPGSGAKVLDLGAGAGHLTIRLAEQGYTVIALEPNSDMRQQGMARTRCFKGVRWIDGVMEDTGLHGNRFALTTYGSSFGVADRAATLRESARLLTEDGWFACMFNHRDLDDPLQRQIEALISDRVPGYFYGSRREDQAPVIAASGLFTSIRRIECPVVHRISASAWMAAWRSHATLQRQAGARFHDIVDRIGEIVAAGGLDTLTIPYVTRVWLARRRPAA